MKHKAQIKPSSAGAEGGFTFIELVIVIILLGLLAAIALPRYLDVTDDAQNASLEGVAGGFTTAVNLARAQWSVDGNRRGAATTPANKVSINLDGKIIYMNENGWPANTGPADDASEDSQTAAECLEVWNSVLQTAPTATSNQSERGNAKFFVTVLEQQGGDDSGNSADMCRYEMILSNDAAVLATHYFDYDLADGEVIITKPNLN